MALSEQEALTELLRCQGGMTSEASSTLKEEMEHCKAVSADPSRNLTHERTHAQSDGRGGSTSIRSGCEANPRTQRYPTQRRLKNWGKMNLKKAPRVRFSKLGEFHMPSSPPYTSEEWMKKYWQLLRKLWQVWEKVQHSQRNQILDPKQQPCSRERKMKWEQCRKRSSEDGSKVTENTSGATLCFSIIYFLERRNSVCKNSRTA